MALTKAQKATQLTELKEMMKKSQSVIFSHYIGMSVADVSNLRKKLKEQNSEMKVAKKTLMQIAAKDLQMPEIEDSMLDGAVACIFSYEDPLSGAQIAFKFSKDHPQVELIGGVFEGKLLTKEAAVRLAKIPGKQQLLGMFAAMLNSPLSSFARGLSELAKQKETPASAEAEPVSSEAEKAGGPAPEAPKAEEPKAEAAPAAEAQKTEAVPAAEETPPTPEPPAAAAPEAPAA